MAQSTPVTEATPEGSLADFWWIAAILAGIGAAVAALVFWRRRKAAAPLLIEPPKVEPAGAAGAVGSDLTDLRVELEAVRVTRSMRNATLAYRLTLTNRGAQALRNLNIGGDLTSAHGRSPIAEQLADPAKDLPIIHAVEHLGAGQRKALTGELRLPLESVRLIRQGKVPIYVPLARIRVSDGKAEPRAFTFVVGKQPQPGVGRLQPFRLDTPPQGFSDVGARALT